MRVCVITNGVTAIGDFAREFGADANMCADEKERHANRMAVEQVEQPRSDGGVWAVIERKGDCARIAGVSNRASEELRGGDASRPGIGSCSATCTGEK